jgi:hypothetical protein
LGSGNQAKKSHGCNIFGVLSNCEPRDLAMRVGQPGSGVTKSESRQLHPLGRQTRSLGAIWSSRSLPSPPLHGFLHSANYPSSLPPFLCSSPHWVSLRRVEESPHHCLCSIPFPFPSILQVSLSEMGVGQLSRAKYSSGFLVPTEQSQSPGVALCTSLSGPSALQFHWELTRGAHRARIRVICSALIGLYIHFLLPYAVPLDWNFFSCACLPILSSSLQTKP